MRKPAIIIPYRNRERYLQVLLSCLPRYLEEINGITDYRIYVSEQEGTDTFRVALARNVGARVALAEEGFDYLVFHDVDIVPLRNVDYRLGDRSMIRFGNIGGCKLDTPVFQRVNGYDSRYAGWGSEDIDLSHRLHFYGQPVDIWPQQEEARDAVMLNLEMDPLDEEGARAYSRWYFGHEGVGPTFVSLSEERPGEGRRNLIELYSKADFCNPTNSAWNESVLARVLGREQQARDAYYQANGARQVDLGGVQVVERKDRIVRITFDPLRAGGPADLPPTLATPSEPAPVTIWTLDQARELHQTSAGLARALTELLPVDQPVLDLGCGGGSYLAELSRWGFRCLGVEATPDIHRIAEFPYIVHGDLSAPLTLNWPPSSVLCLEVGEHVLPEQEGALLDNIARHCGDWAVLSWALPGQYGFGHNNCRSNEHVIAQMSRRGFVYLEEPSRRLRTAADADGTTPWFRETIMVFRNASALLAGRPPPRRSAR